MSSCRGTAQALPVGLLRALQIAERGVREAEVALRLRLAVGVAQLRVQLAAPLHLLDTERQLA